MPHSAPTSRPGAGRIGPAAAVLGTLLAAALIFGALPAAAQPGGKGPNGAAVTAPAQVAAKAAISKPAWRDLSSRQKSALEPLAANWDELTEPHKQKWLAISRNYARMSPEEQEVLHSRMTEWSRLSNQQREQARLNFAAVKQLPADERKAKWEAYQALSEAEKRKLAERASTARPNGAAPSIRPAAEQKFAPVPSLALDGQHIPRIQLAPPAPLAAPRPAQAAPVAVSAPVPAEAQVPPPSALPAAADAPAVASHPGERPAVAP